LNVLDWSKSNVVGIALKDQVYLWTAHTAEIVRLPCDVERGVENVCALTFLQSGSHIVTSLDRGVQQIWDIEQVKIIRNLRTDETNCRIAALGMHSNLLVGGNRAGTLRFHDLRVQKHEVATIRKAHTQEICGVKWSPDGRFCATGGNDNTIHIWDAANISSTATPVCSFTEHMAAIKALCWSPCRQGILASGGGTNDRTIKIWNVSTSRMLKSVDAESQVSGLLWHEGYREIVSSHGFSKHHLAVWKYPDMTKAGDMVGHSLRVLSMALSPDETTVVSVSADETLRFWRVFPPTKSMTKKKAEGISGLKTMQFIR
jgi:WD40 repeat protein